jgi:hypothetical protein
MIPFYKRKDLKILFIKINSFYRKREVDIVIIAKVREEIA